MEVAKALKGIDGYGAKFFKATWDITKKDVINAVLEFFEEKMMYSAINNAILTLIPWSTNVNMMNDYMPISCYTTIYKIIYKIMTTRLSKILRSIIN